MGHCDAFYDRAALVALPADWRDRYVRHLRALVPSEAPGLVVTFEYDQTRMSGPPFDVPESEVRRVFAGTTVELLARAPADFQRSRATGIDITECCYAVNAHCVAEPFGVSFRLKPMSETDSYVLCTVPCRQ